MTGDSHSQSVRETNLGFRQGETGGFTNHARSQPPSFRPRPYPNQNQQFRPSTPNYQGQHFRRLPPPPFGQNHAQRPPLQFRPRPPRQFRPRPPDYRNWEYAKLARPPSSGNCFVFCYLRVFSGCTSSSFLIFFCGLSLCFTERFTVLSYNILADYLATDHRSKLYFHIPPHMMDWEWRKRKIFFELGLWSADIMCFQVPSFLCLKWSIFFLANACDSLSIISKDIHSFISVIFKIVISYQPKKIKNKIVTVLIV